MLKMKTMGPFMATIFLLLASVSYAYSYPKLPNTENIVINVTAGTLGDAQLQESNNLQINLNISVDEEQVLVNDIPVELSGVTRFNCQALLLDSANGTTEFESGSIVSAVTRVMVNQNRLYSDSEEVVSLQVFSEVIELEGKEVQQPDMCEVKILMDPSYQKLAQYTNIYPIGHSEISRIPRENDVVVTDPTNRQKDSAEERAAWQTTSRYGGKPAVTTVEEFAAPGRLPEVPLRMLPGPEEEERTPAQSDLTRTDSQQTEPLSSYSAMCDWVVQAREHLRRFCSESLPLFFLVMWVVVIGVVGSAVIVKILDLFFPTCEHKRSYHLNNITVLPEEEKHTLLDAIEVEVAADEGEEEQRKRP